MPELVDQIRFQAAQRLSIDRSVRLPAGDRNGIQRLARGPFSLARLIRVTTPAKSSTTPRSIKPQRFPELASEDLCGGVARNFQVFGSLDFLAELTEHIPNQGQHLVRYYGHYSNKSSRPPRQTGHRRARRTTGR